MKNQITGISRADFVQDKAPPRDKRLRLEARTGGRLYASDLNCGWSGGTFVEAEREACDDYKDKRANGTDEDSPPQPFPERGGRYTWDTPGRARSCIRYTEGPDAKVWMEERDLNYILRLDREHRLLELEPNADTEIAPDHSHRGDIVLILRRARENGERAVKEHDERIARERAGQEVRQLREELGMLRRQLSVHAGDSPHNEEEVVFTSSEFGRLSISFVIPYSELTLRTEIGSGGFGVVYRGAYQGATVAIKQLKAVMSDEAKGEFRHEAEIMFRLRHPNIIPLFGICTEPGHYCMVMQYATNGSLYQFLHSEHPLEWPLRWNIAIDIAQGILYLHTQNILHRDLKSLNVLLDGSMRAKITDFGLARVKSESRTAYYGAGFVGTPAWLAPELLTMDARARYSKASDVYGYAIILWEIATRRIPYEGISPFVMIPSVIGGERQDIPAECPSQYAATIRRCWAQRAEDRPSIENVVRDLGAGRGMP